MSSTTLNEIFRFGHEELEQNRNGNLSGYQQKMLRRSGRITFIALALLGLFIALGVYHVNQGKNDTPLQRAVITGGVFFLVGGWLWIRACILAVRSRVQRVSGTVALVYRKRTGNCVAIGNKMFPVGGRVQELFKAHKEYIIYYTGTSTILSVEEKT